jgi:hypothetical protein
MSTAVHQKKKRAAGAAAVREAAGSARPAGSARGCSRDFRANVGRTGPPIEERAFGAVKQSLDNPLGGLLT